MVVLPEASAQRKNWQRGVHSGQRHNGSWRCTGHWDVTRPIRRHWRPFWAFALGYVKEQGFDEPDNASIIDPGGRGPAIGFLQVPEGKTAKNRMHIDIRVAGEGPWDMAERERLIRATVPRLQEAGAAIVREEFYGQMLGHVVMQDPEGNEFCVA